MVKRRRGDELSHMICVKMCDQRVVEAGNALRQVTLNITRDPRPWRARCIGMRICFRDTISGRTRVNQQCSPIRKDEERGVSAPCRNLVNVQRSRSPRRERLADFNPGLGQ